jgi:hypothetical protein
MENLFVKGLWSKFEIPIQHVTTEAIANALADAVKSAIEG